MIAALHYADYHDFFPWKNMWALEYSERSKNKVHLENRFKVKIYYKRGTIQILPHETKIIYKNQVDVLTDFE